MIDATTFADAYSAGYGYTVKFLASKGDREATDRAQDAWGRAWAKREHFRGQCTIRTWATVIGWNLFRMEYRRTRGYVFEPLGWPGPVVGDSSHKIEAGIDTQRILDRLPERERQALGERYLSDWDYEDMAAARGISYLGVKTAVFRARGKALAAAGGMR